MKKSLKLEDLYSGYDTDNESGNLMDSDHIRDAMRTSYGQRKTPFVKTTPVKKQVPGVPPCTAINKNTTTHRPFTAYQRGILAPNNTGSILTEEGESSKSDYRPLTANRAAGFVRQKGKRRADKENYSKDPSISLLVQEETPQESNKKLEQDVIRLIEESVVALDQGNNKVALEKAKRAVHKENLLIRHREIGGIETQSYLDISYSVRLNLATVYEGLDMPEEAITTYYEIIRNKAFPNAAKLRVNLGNLFFAQGKLTDAIKMYRRALDNISEDYSAMRCKILMNIGNVFVKLEQYSEAVSSYEHIMKKDPNHKTTFHLILCYHALTDIEKMKRSFQRLLVTYTVGHGKQESYTVPDDNNPALNLLVSCIKTDSLKKMEDSQKSEIERYILQSARLIAPYICETEGEGFEWCVENIKNSEYMSLAAELEICKAMVLLRKNDFSGAVQTLSVFEKKTSKIASHAANNLSFLYFHKLDLEQAEKYVDESVKYDTYNYRAYVNKGNIMFRRRMYKDAERFYHGALTIESDCVEAHYNLGLTYKALGQMKVAEKCFEKYNKIIHCCPEVLYQLATISLAKKEIPEAINRLTELLTIVPNDPSASCALANIYSDLGDFNSAYQYMYEAFKALPCSISVISWLAQYFFHNKVYEKAAQFFERAILVEPAETRWYLYIASCQQRSGLYQDAFISYRAIDVKFPNNVTCLTLLVKLCRDLGLKELEKYEEKLRKSEELCKSKNDAANSKDGGRALSAPKPRPVNSLSASKRDLLSRSSIREKSAPGVISRDSDKARSGNVKKELSNTSNSITHSTTTHSNTTFDGVDLEELVPDCSSQRSLSVSDKKMTDNTSEH